MSTDVNTRSKGEPLVPEVVDGATLLPELPESPEYLDGLATEVLDSLSPHQRGFLGAYATNGGNVVQAAAAVGLSRFAHYAWLSRSENYRHAFEWAKVAMVDYLESEALRRAVEGWEEPVYGKDGIIGTKQRFSDTLLIFMLKGAAPEKYADFSVQKRQIISRSEQHVQVDVRVSVSESLDELHDRLQVEQARAAEALAKLNDPVPDDDAEE